MERWREIWDRWSEDHPGCLMTLVVVLGLWFLGWALILLAFVKIYSDFG